MNMKQKIMVAVVAVSTMVAAPSAFALDTGPIISSINENFTATEAVAVSVIGGFAGLMVFKLIKRLL